MYIYIYIYTYIYITDVLFAASRRGELASQPCSEPSRIINNRIYIYIYIYIYDYICRYTIIIYTYSITNVIMVWQANSVRPHRTRDFRERATSALAELGGEICNVSRNRARAQVPPQARKSHVYGSGTWCLLVVFGSSQRRV